MINFKDIKIKANKLYAKYLTSLVLGEDIFPIEIKGDKGSKLQLIERIEGMKTIYKNSKESLGYGYSLVTTNKNTKNEGSQTFISNIIISNESDFLKLIGKEDESKGFKRATKKLLKYPLVGLISKNPKLIANNLDIIDDSIKVIDFFINNSVDNFYARDLPIDIHTKFIENNSSFLISLLDNILSPRNINSDEKTFSKRYGLKFDDNFYIYIRSLDSKIKLNGFSEVALPWAEVDNLTLNPKNIFIVENRVNYLLFKNRSNSIVIWGQGRAVTKLKELTLLKKSNIHYWGDIDPSGFEILNSLRLYYPETKSIYMDIKTLEQYHKFIVRIQGFKQMDLINLTTEEAETYRSLFCDGYQIRLEQENIRV